MTITLPPQLESSLVVRAKQHGTTPEELAVDMLQKLLPPLPPLVPQDEWERRILEIGVDTGYTVTDRAARDRALSSDGLYD